MNILNRTKVIVGLLFVGLISNGSLLAQLPKVSDARLGVDCLRLSDGKRLYGRSAARELRAGDTLVLEANPDALDEFRANLKLAFSEATKAAA